MCRGKSFPLCNSFYSNVFKLWVFCRYRYVTFWNRENVAFAAVVGEKDEEDMFEISSVLSPAHSKYQCIPISSFLVKKYRKKCHLYQIIFYANSPRASFYLCPKIIHDKHIECILNSRSCEI